MIERYTVYWVDLEPTIGSEMAKHRPAVVISDDAMNARLQTVVVCPLTSRIHESWPSRIQTSATGRGAEIAIDQIHTVSRRRIGDAIGTLSSPEAAAVRHVITEMYGLLCVDRPRE